MTELYPIKDNAPENVPAITRGPRKVAMRLTAEKLKINQSFIAPDKRHNAVSTMVSRVGAASGKKFTTRKVDGGIEVFRIA